MTYRESAGTGPVNLKIVPSECCLGKYGCASLSHHPLFIGMNSEGGMLKLPAYNIMIADWTSTGMVANSARRGQLAGFFFCKFGLARQVGHPLRASACLNMLIC